MLLSLVYFTVCRLLRAVVLTSRDDGARGVELLVLRHQVKVLARRAHQPPFRRRDRMLLAAASRGLPRERWMALVVTPRTLLRCHWELVRRRWTYRRGRPPGQPPLGEETVELVVRLAKENPRWRYLRVRGEPAAARRAGVRHRHTNAPAPAPPRSRSSPGQPSSRTPSGTV